MKIMKNLSSRNLFIFNLVLIGAIFGFSLAFLSFSCTTPQARAQAQQNPVIIPEDALTAAEALQTVFNSVTEKVLPSVVEIKTVSITTRQSQGYNGIPWEFFFGPRDQQTPNQEREYRSQGLGSGIIVRNKNGLYYALTNNHVVEGATEITVAVRDGREYPAEVVGIDERKDLALISFKTNDYHPLAVLGDSDNVKVGNWAIAMGNPLGEQFSFSTTLGIISAVGRTGGPGNNISDYIQTDAPINQGNSGGPLINIKGEVIGINTWIASNQSGGGNVGLGFAIPINNAKRSIDEFIETGTASYGWLGVQLMETSREVNDGLGLGSARGALVSQVFLGGPADKGGIKPGDFITHVNGRETRTYQLIQLAVSDLRAGETAVFTVIRDRQQMDIRVTIEARNEQTAADNRGLWPGVTVSPLTDQLRQTLNLGRNATGLVVTQVASGSPADIIGLRAGDRIHSINGQSISDIASFYKTLRERTAATLWFGLFRGESSLESLRFNR